MTGDATSPPPAGRTPRRRTRRRCRRRPLTPYCCYQRGSGRRCQCDVRLPRPRPRIRCPLRPQLAGASACRAAAAVGAAAETAAGTAAAAAGRGLRMMPPRPPRLPGPSQRPRRRSPAPHSCRRARTRGRRRPQRPGAPQQPRERRASRYRQSPPRAQRWTYRRQIMVGEAGAEAAALEEPPRGGEQLRTTAHPLPPVTGCVRLPPSQQRPPRCLSTPPWEPACSLPTRAHTLPRPGVPTRPRRRSPQQQQQPRLWSARAWPGSPSPFPHPAPAAAAAA